MYTFMGKFGWEQQAKQYGVKKIIKRQPYLVNQENKHV